MPPERGPAFCSLAPTPGQCESLNLLCKLARSNELKLRGDQASRSFVSCSSLLSPSRAFTAAYFDCRRSTACTIYWMKSESTTGFYHYINFAASFSHSCSLSPDRPVPYSRWRGPKWTLLSLFSWCSFSTLLLRCSVVVMFFIFLTGASHLIYRHRATTGIYIYRFIETIFH